jgi:ribonucleotide monophosphatase NagD (HAD superfamily)
VRPRALLLDIDGVLYVEDAPVYGAGAAVQRLRAAGSTLRFVTNTTSRSRGRRSRSCGDSDSRSTTTS